jgi:hypothetical protein
MTRSMGLGLLLAGGILAFGACDDKRATTTSEPTPSATTAATSSAKPAQSAVPAAEPTATASPQPTSSATAKKYDCGEKGQKPCPMQGWMKTVMGTAASSGDGAKLADALNIAAGKPPKGMDQWTALAKAGAAKAKANDIDGAKLACKQCHDLYKEEYKLTMRDHAW